MGEISIFHLSEIGTFREKLSKQPVCILIGTALPRRIQISKINVQVMGRFQIGIACKLLSSISRSCEEGPCRVLVGYCEIATPSAISIDKAVRSGMRAAVYWLVLRSINVATQPLLFPQPDTTVSSSQCPNVSRKRTSLGRFEMDRAAPSTQCPAS